MPAMYGAEDWIVQRLPSSLFPIHSIVFVGSNWDLGLHIQPSRFSGSRSCNPSAPTSVLSYPYTSTSSTYYIGRIPGMWNFPSVILSSFVAIGGLCVHPNGRLWKPHTLSCTPILIVPLSCSGIQQD